MCVCVLQIYYSTSASKETAVQKNSLYLKIYMFDFYTFKNMKSHESQLLSFIISSITVINKVITVVL